MFRLALPVLMFAIGLSAQPTTAANAGDAQRSAIAAGVDKNAAAIDKNGAAVAAVAAASATAAAKQLETAHSEYIPLLLVSCTTLLSTVITLLVGVWQRGRENAWQLAREAIAADHRAQMMTAMSTTQANIVLLEKNTNSIKDALVKTTGEAERAKGVLEGKLDERNKEA